MIHANVHENEYQVTIQAVFRKPENLSQSAFYIDETLGNHALNSERSSTFSSTFNSDGNRRSFLVADIFFKSHVDEYTREKSQPTKTKKRAKKRPQSASVAGTESVRMILVASCELQLDSFLFSSSSNPTVL